MVYEFSIIDLLPYVLMLLILNVLKNSESFEEDKALWCFGAMFLFSACRYGIGYDYYAYKDISEGLTVSGYDRLEFLSKLLADIASFTHYQVFFVLSSFLTLFPLLVVSKRLSVNPTYSLIIYFLFPIFYLESLSIVRNAIAYSFVLLAYLYLSERKIVLSVLMVFVAFLFHKSGAIGFIIYIIYYIKNRWDIHLILYVASFLLTVAVMNLVGRFSSAIPLLALIEHYAEASATGGGLMTYIINAIAIINFLFWRRLVEYDPRNSVYLGLVNVGVFMWNLFLIVDSTIALRLSSFFVLFDIFLIPQYGQVVSEKLSVFVDRSVYIFFLLLFMSSFVVSIRSYDGTDRMSNLPYQTVFYHTDYYNYLY